MVLTDRQRSELHSGIYEYLISQTGASFKRAADALAQADPTIKGIVVGSPTRSQSKTIEIDPSASSSKVPILERKWTAIAKLQLKVLELEKQLESRENRKVLSSAVVTTTTSSLIETAGISTEKRFLPRSPATHSLQGHSAVVTCVILHPIYTHVVSGGEDSMIKVNILEINSRYLVPTISFASTAIISKLILVKFQIWDHESGEYMKTLKGHTRTVHALAFTSTGSHLASASADLTIKVWDYTSQTCIRTLRGHEHVVSAIRFLSTWNRETERPSNGLIRGETNVSSSGLDINTTGSSFLISSSRDCTVKFWALESWYCEHTVSDHSDWVRCLTTRYDGGVLATAGSDKNIFIYSITLDAIRKTKRVATLQGHEHVIESLSFIGLSGNMKHHIDASMNLLVSGGRDKSVRLWDINSEVCLGIFTHHENWVRTVLFHPSGDYIISAGDDRTIRVLDLKVR